MAYTITRTNGQNSVVIPDGTINTETTVTLVGKNYPNYGAILGQNFIRLLENSSNGIAPSSPIVGELWWDSANTILKVWTGIQWKNVGSTTSGSTAPLGAHNVGDLWWNTATGQLWAYDGNISDYKLIGPIGGTGGVSAEILNDTGGNPHNVVSMSIGGYRYLILSSSAIFTPSPSISGFQTISPGLNLANTAFLTNAKFIGMATNALQLGGYYANSFMRSDTNTTTSGTISITNNNGLYVGAINDLNLSVNSPNVAITSNTNAGVMNMIVRNSSGTLLDAMDIYSNGNVVCNYDLVIQGTTKFGGGSGDLVIPTTTSSINTITGSIITRGGIGIAGNINTGGTQNNFVGQVRAGSLYSNGSITGSLATAAQPAITSLGTLTGLTVVGTTTLGSVSTVKISGGSSGYLLKTDGTGNLSWASPAFIPTDTTDLTNGANFVTSGVLSSTLTAYVTGTSLTSTLTGYVTNSSLTSTLSSYVTNSSLTSTLANYELKTALTTTLADYVTLAYLSGLGLGTGDVSAAGLSATLANYVTNTALTTRLGSASSNYVLTSTLSSTLGSYVTTSALTAYGYLTSESSTLDAVLGRGATSTKSLTTGALTVNGALSVGSTYNLSVGGAITAGGDITAYSTSDGRLKSNIQPITNALNKVSSLNGITYAWNETGLSLFDSSISLPLREAGIIAQEVNDVLPEVVTIRDDSGYFAVRYERLIPLLIEAIKELKAEVEILKKK